MFLNRHLTHKTILAIARQNSVFANDADTTEVWVLPADGIERVRQKAEKQTAVKGLGEDAFLAYGMHGLDDVISLSRTGKRRSSFP